MSAAKATITSFVPGSEIERTNRSFSENALKMMRKRYLAKNEKDEQETPADMFFRVARTLAEVEARYGKDKRFIDKTTKEFFDIFATNEYTAAGRTMTNVEAETDGGANRIALPAPAFLGGVVTTPM